MSLRPIRHQRFQPTIDALKRLYPDLGGRIRCWNTGEPRQELEGIRAIVFLLQDPLRELFPECFEEAYELAQRARRRGIRIVNAPEALSNTIKSVQARLWREEGLPSPPHFPFNDYRELTQVVREASFPAILRADRLHGQSEMRYCEFPRDVMSLSRDAIPYPGTLVPVVDTREGFRTSEPGSVWAEFYHKKRAFVFGRRVVNNHLFFGKDPIVGAKTCTFSHYRSLNPLRRLAGRLACREHAALDRAFSESPPDDASTLRRAAEVLNLEFVAIDYSSRADGGIVLWEANPYFALHTWPFMILPRQRKVKERHERFFAVIHAFFGELMELESDHDC